MELSDGAALGGVGVAKEVLQNSTPICTTAPWSWQLQGVLELGCLAEIFAGVAGVLEWSHAKQALNVDEKKTNYIVSREIVRRIF